MTKKKLSKKERIMKTLCGETVDRIACLGGWNNGLKNVADLAGISTEEYAINPVGGVVKANLALGVDGMVAPVVPKTLEEIISGSTRPESMHEGTGPEAILQKAEKIPDSEGEILSEFNPKQAEREFSEYFDFAYKNWGGIEPIPNFWEFGGHFPLYHEYGYTAFLMACALYPEAVFRIWRQKSIISRERAKVMAGIYKRYNLVPIMFCGEDVCNNSGPMVSPDFLRKYYFPTVKMITEPLVNEGIRFIHHCDGDVRPVIKDFIDAGFSGFQGFQYELGVDPYEIAGLKSSKGEDVIMFAGLSVTRTLPFGTLEDVEEEVDYLLDACDGGRNMFLFTSNVTGVEVAPENIRSAYDHVRQWDPEKKRNRTEKTWPWSLTHSEDL